MRQRGGARRGDDFWRDIARTSRRFIALAGLKIGVKLNVVSWTVDDLYDREHMALYEGIETPPAITWKARSMAQEALRLLNALRADPLAEPRRVLVPTRVRVRE